MPFSKRGYFEDEELDVPAKGGPLLACPGLSLAQGYMVVTRKA